MTRDLALFAVCLLLLAMAVFHFTRYGAGSWELIVDAALLYIVLRNWRPWRRP